MAPSSLSHYTALKKYFFIFKVKKIHRLSASLGEKKDDRHDIELRLAAMISTIVMVFVVCNSFESIVFILTSQEMLPLDIVQDYLRPCADLLMVINSSVNIVIYCVFKRDFREKLLQLYFRCKCRKVAKNKQLVPSKEMPMIPMIRAQLPKTSVEFTYATEKQHQKTDTPEEAMPFLLTENIGKIASGLKNIASPDSLHEDSYDSDAFGITHEDESLAQDLTSSCLIGIVKNPGSAEVIAKEIGSLDMNNPNASKEGSMTSKKKVEIPMNDVNAMMIKSIILDVMDKVVEDEVSKLDNNATDLTFSFH